MSKRVCVVGAGRWGANHARTLRELGVLAGIVEPDASARDGLAQRYPDVNHFEDLDAALSADFDGFTVATPAESHAEVGARILERGRPVLIEKPLALDVAGARRLCELAERRGVTLMVGHLMLFHPAIRRIKQLIDEGKIGKLEYLYSNRLNLGTVRTEENILWSFAPHDISMFQYLVGDAPLDVLSRGGAFVQPHLHDTTLTFLRYPHNVTGHIFLSWLHPFKEHRLVVIGSKGMFTYEDSSPDRAIRFYEKGVDWIRGEPVERDGPTELIPHEGEAPLTAELRYFVEHLEAGGVELADGRNGVEILEILERATASLLGEEPTPGAGYVHPTSCVDDDVEIGEGTRIWHYSHVQGGARIGRHCSIGQNAYVASNVRIGDFVKIQNNVSVYEGVELEDYVFCGPSMVFTNVSDPRSKYPQKGSDRYRPTLVRHGASIGANATILCGHTIGRHAFVGAGAVVTGDVPDHALVVGVPARQTGWVCECGEILPEADAGGGLGCPRCARGYRLADGRLETDVPR